MTRAAPSDIVVATLVGLFLGVTLSIGYAFGHESGTRECVKEAK